MRIKAREEKENSFKFSQRENKRKLTVENKEILQSSKEGRK